MDATTLDGNAVAGLLREVFAVEMTTAVGTCTHCGTSEVLGVAHAYHGAGMVLRCAECETALVKIVRAGTRVWIAFPGVQTLEIRLDTA